MIKFLHEGLEELSETARQVKSAAYTYFQQHFPSNKPERRVVLFAMLSYAALILTLPKVLSLLLAFPVVILVPILLGAIVFAQASMGSAVFWGQRIKRLENRLPSCYASLQENTMLLLGLAVFSWLPLPGLQLRALLLLPLLTTEAFMAKQLIVKALNTTVEELRDDPVKKSCEFLWPLVSYSGVKTTAEFFGLSSPFEASS
jgi:hypothetical protein